jgi:hypothetical protein
MRFFLFIAFLGLSSFSNANEASRDKFIGKYGECLSAIEKRNVAQLGASNIIIGSDYVAVNGKKGLEMYSEEFSTVVSSTSRECKYEKKSVSEGIKKALTGDPTICADCISAPVGKEGKALQALSVKALEVCGKVDDDLSAFTNESLKSYGKNSSTSSKKSDSHSDGAR